MRSSCLATFALGMALALAPATAANLCPSAAADLQRDPALAEAIKAAYGAVGFVKGEGCIYPLKRLTYADADVLIAQKGVPGEGCHGCAGVLDAVVFARRAGALRRVKAFPSFGDYGSNGGSGDVRGFTLGADDAIAVEGGGTFQGYTSSAVDFYAFRHGGLIHLDAGATLLISADDGGAVEDDSKTTSVEARWAFSRDGDELTIDYKINDVGGVRDARAVWSVGETKLTLKSGAVPKEILHAAGQE